jgi:hypothetical protein
MRSYEAARSLFSFLSFIAWCLIIAGIGAAILGGMIGAELAQWNRVPTFVGRLIGALPGFGLSIFGFLSLAMAQTGRAGVDSAEYGQQMLQISRDQLEVSRQSMRQGEAVKTALRLCRSNKWRHPLRPMPISRPDRAALPRTVMMQYPHRLRPRS